MTISRAGDEIYWSDGPIYMTTRKNGVWTMPEALPFTREVSEFIDRYEQVFVIDMNRDGQMKQILTIEYPEKATSLKSVAYGDGMPASARWIREGILARYEAAGATDGKNGKSTAQADLAPLAN